MYTLRGWCIISTCCIQFHSMVMYISSAVNNFRSMCISNNILCRVIYIPHKELDYYVPEDSRVYRENSVTFQKCSWCQPPSLWLCHQVSFQSTWSPDYLRWNNFWKAPHPFGFSLSRCEIHLWTVLENEETVT